MLFDQLFNLMNPGVTLGLLAGIIGVFAAATAAYVKYESRDHDCAVTGREQDPAVARKSGIGPTVETSQTINGCQMIGVEPMF